MDCEQRACFYRAIHCPYAAALELISLREAALRPVGFIFQRVV
jgi:hypothetical protein